MASTDRIFVSPGVFTSEKDLTFVTRQVGVTTLGLVGETPKGPAFDPVFISDYTQFQQFFGGLNSEKFEGSGFQKYELNYIAKSFLSQTNQLYVSRVLGLSGYKAGSAWSITINADVDSSTTATTTTSSVVTLLTYSASTAGTPTTLVWGDANLEALYGAGEITSSFTNLGNVADGGTISITSPKYVKTGSSFSGATFDMEVTERGTTSGGSIITGVTSGTVVTYTGTSYTDIEDRVVATLRSRGSVNSDELMEFDVTASTSVNIVGDGVESDPLSNFSITGTNRSSESFTYDVSLDTTKKNYITKVLGVSAQDKVSELFVEEIYKNSLDDLNAAGKVRGLNTTIVQMDSTLNDYSEEYQSASSPFILSELRGNTLERLFRVITISDGDAANKDIKVSILNIKPDEKTFDLIVRKFSDDDTKPTIVEKFSKLSMEPTDNGFIGRKIGTSNNEYLSKSNFILIEMADNYPTDAFPSGFEGVMVRDYDGENVDGVAPKIEYKTSYSSQEKKRKAYLGLSTSIGIDQDFFNYKGEDAWTGKTDGFHMDSGVTTTTIAGISNTFQVGSAEFRNDSDLIGTDYEKLDSRKFTFAPFGGFDGWDIYRTQRTNGDGYTINGAKGKLGGPSGTGQFGPYVTPTATDGITSDYYAYFKGVRSFDNPESTNINIFATPGIDSRDNISLVNEAIDMVEEERADSLYIITTPDTDSSGVVAMTTDEAVDVVADSGIDSNYSATYFPWLQMQDTENNQYVWLPPTVEVVRNIALTDNIAFPWFATAGVNRGTTNAIKARTKLTLDQRDTLYEGMINPMATFSTVGVVIWGNKTLQSKETALNRINVRRLLLQARKLISAVSIRLLFEQNDSVVRNQFLSLVNPILDNIRKERGLTDFRVQVDSDPESIDRNELNGRIFIKPTRSLEYISVEFNITNTGANFDNI
ncbi:phage tail sheath subtilisin-like domain-containing protein [bacterium]|nr:phage tail sheath subtilisin-like domain-containing protein [bacterium]